MRYFVVVVASGFPIKMKTTVESRAEIMSCSKAALAQYSQRCALQGRLVFRLLRPGLLLLKPLDLDMHRRESFLLELIAQRVGGFLLCFSNQSSSFYEGNTVQLCLLKFRLWESRIQLCRALHVGNHSDVCISRTSSGLNLKCCSSSCHSYKCDFPLPRWPKAAAWLIAHQYSFCARWPPGHEPSFHDRHRQHGSCCLRSATWPHRPEAESRQPDRPAC